MFADLLIETLFKPGSHVNPDHKHKYIHLLAYAVSVHETHKKVREWNWKGQVGQGVTVLECDSEHKRQGGGMEREWIFEIECDCFKLNER